MDLVGWGSCVSGGENIGYNLLYKNNEIISIMTSTFNQEQRKLPPALRLLSSESIEK